MKTTKKIACAVLAVVMCFVMLFATPVLAQSSNLIKNVNVATAVPQGFVGVYTADDLAAVRNDLDGKYILMNDIDLSDVEDWTSVGTENYPFTGIFNGNGYAVKNLKQESNSALRQVLGLFGVAENAVIANLKVENVNINQKNVDHSFVGGIVGVSWSSVIVNCYCSGAITVSATNNIFVGGIAGTSPVIYVDNAKVENTTFISNCASDVDIKITAEGEENMHLIEYTDVGGIVGEFKGKNTISRCVSNGDINVVSKNYANVGGIAGSVIGASVSNCANNGAVTIGTTGGAASAGGICGEFSDIIENCYNTAKISLDDSSDAFSLASAYGIAGCIERSGAERIIRNCFYSNENEMAVRADDVKLTRVKAFAADAVAEKSTFKRFDFKKVWNEPAGAAPTLRNDIEALESSVEVKVNRRKNTSDLTVLRISSDENIAVIEDDGRIKGIAEGTTTVDIVTSEGQILTINVTVIPQTIWDKIIDGIVSVFNAIFSVIG